MGSITRTAPGSFTATSSPATCSSPRRRNTTKLADFGIAKAAEQTRITQVGAVLGTAAYLSPEQAHGEEAGPASDIYSLGVCAYQFLTGRLPHEYSSLTELALKQQQDPVTPITELRPEVPPELDAAIRLCLERRSGDRYRSALELAQALEAGLRGESTNATRVLAIRRADLVDSRPPAHGPTPRRPRPPSPPMPRPRPLRLAATAATPPGSAPAQPSLPLRAAARAGGDRRSGTRCAGLRRRRHEVDAPDANDVQQQIQELRDFIQDNSP